MVPEAATLLAWAAELGIEIGTPEGDGVAEAPARHTTSGGATREDLLQVLLIKGTVPAGQLAAALSSDPEPVNTLAGRLVADGLAENAGDGCRLTGAGRLRALEVFASDRDRFGAGRSAAALEAFRALDARMKDTVTAWQLRTDGDEPQLNDHTDAGYDARVLGMLTQLHADTLDWMTPLTEAFRRFGRYRDRLEEALGAVRCGDQRYVASPRVDSYHSIWFEVHEDLIRLAGQERSSEQAGR
jgi:pyruvate,orthophosphate dikinase